MSTPPNSDSLLQPARVLPFAYPLDEFYALANRELPLIEQVRGDEVPEPWRTLLVHNNDMTPTLETFHNDGLFLEVISRHHRGDFYFREVVLHTDKTKKAVEFGAIKINLGLFPSSARPRILQEQQPLGGILREHKIPHTSKPKAFLKVTADEFIKGALKLRGTHVLYGRRNTLFDAQQRPLAEIVEILPDNK
jgi:chorismate-pyruvate lyase